MIWNFFQNFGLLQNSKNNNNDNLIDIEYDDKSKQKVNQENFKKSIKMPFGVKSEISQMKKCKQSKYRIKKNI